MPELAGKTGAERSRLVYEAMAQVEMNDQAYLMVPVHFATHRTENPTATDEDYDPYNRFGAESAAQLACGRAIVTGAGGASPDSSKSRRPGGSAAASFTVHTIEVFRGQTVQDMFLSDLKGAIEPSKHKELLVFLHGYRTSFSSGLMRAAQLKVDMKIEGAVVLYSLPLKGSLWAMIACP
jgi:esterase/lipase superfamily enzyme